MGFKNKLVKSGLIRQQTSSGGIALTNVYAEVARIAIPAGIFKTGRTFRFEVVWENAGSATDNDGALEQRAEWTAPGGGSTGQILAGLSDAGSISNALAPPVPVSLGRSFCQTVLRADGSNIRADSMFEGSIEYEGGNVTVTKRKSEPNILADSLVGQARDLVLFMRCLSGGYDVTRVHAFVDLMGELLTQ